MSDVAGVYDRDPNDPGRMESGVSQYAIGIVFYSLICFDLLYYD